MKSLFAACTAAVVLAAPVAAAPDDDIGVGSAAGRQRGAVERSERPLIQNKLWWFGRPNPNPPERVVIREVAHPLWEQRGWFSGTDREGCLFGVSRVIGPYGTSTVAVGRGCN